ncbi:hypothetical protein PRIPAC_71274 [Pristionchus pacificus]|uniref:RING-type domain-containing protein n=1 Tax=Pristionchus pacificus TaxID=54126 RepID=A0A2A6CT18_PRIPA|nr:hypothetical protein PRIPAC_71274 [Pristionchus pacificus]|eukprot:PDM81260.1 hypothetical protein PRIPAC_36263 [Pristionchus pacificus]
MPGNKKLKSNKNQKEETSIPSTIEIDNLLTPPSYAQLNAALNKLSREFKDGSFDEIDHFRHLVIDEQRRASARSAACSQQFPRDCLSCGTESPLRRTVCANSHCGGIVCSTCANAQPSCPRCAVSTEFLRLFEEDSRECVICVETPFGRSAFSGCGHIVCTACALTLYKFQGSSLCCPFCRAPSRTPMLLEPVRVRIGQIETSPAQSKNVDSFKLWFSGFSRVLKTIGILVFAVEPPLAPDDVTSISIFALFLGSKKC